jgi:tetratricopeptide (TPR) repeat protein
VIRPSRVVSAGAFLVALAAVPVHAQQPAPDSSAHASATAPAARDSATVPSRPKLDPSADSNSAQANYAYGMKMVYDNPEEAVRAFYWASRIDPSSGDALYALWTAKLITLSDAELDAYLDRGQAKRTHSQLALDSLIYRAYEVNPFLFSSIDGALMRRTLQADASRIVPRLTAEQRSEFVARRMRAAENQPSIAYSEGRFQAALDAYAFQLEASRLFGEMRAKKNPSAKEKRYAEMVKVGLAYARADMHAKRARIFFQLHELDSASTEMTAALSAMEAPDSGADQLLYLSKAIFDQSLGLIHEHDRRFDLAREAYGRALQEDLSYYPAHGRIAQLELEKGDTTSALSEMDLAVQLEPGDPALRYRYAEVLVHARRDAEAAQQLRKSIALDAEYGSPHLLLATIGDLEGYATEAIDEYQRYVALAARNDPQLPRVKMRLAKLSASLASTQPH